MTESEEISVGENASERQWPGVVPAQAFVIPSYQWMLTRLEAVDSRIQALLGFVSSVTLAVPAISHVLRQNMWFSSPWFISAMGTAVAVFSVGIYARARGSVKLPHPTTFFKRWLWRPSWQFQKDVLCFAGKHFEANRLLVEWKAAAVTIMSVLFAVEWLLLLVWLTRA